MSNIINVDNAKNCKLSEMSTMSKIAQRQIPNMSNIVKIRNENIMESNEQQSKALNKKKETMTMKAKQNKAKR